MTDRCKHKLVKYILCYDCYIEKHGKLESFDLWVKRVTSMREANENERTQLWLEVEEWMSQTPSEFYFKRWRWDAKSVLAEYLANKRNTTMFGLKGIDKEKYPNAYAVLSEDK